MSRGERGTLDSGLVSPLGPNHDVGHGSPASARGHGESHTVNGTVRLKREDVAHGEGLDGLGVHVLVHTVSVSEVWSDWKTFPDNLTYWTFFFSLSFYWSFRRQKLPVSNIPVTFR